MKTITPFNVNSGGWTAYTPATVCRTIIVRETSKPATTDFLIATPTTNDGPITWALGEPFTFNTGKQFQPSDSVQFYLKTVTGSVNFDAIEI